MVVISNIPSSMWDHVNKSPYFRFHVNHPNGTAARCAFREVDPQRGTHSPAINGSVEDLDALACLARTKLDDGTVANIAHDSPLTNNLIEKLIAEIVREANRARCWLFLFIERWQRQALKQVRF
jgi:hypothetical protein